MKKLLICDNYCYIISNEDYEALKRVSPSMSNLASDEDDHSSPTHFVCPDCGQISPVKLRSIHNCKKNPRA